MPRSSSISLSCSINFWKRGSSTSGRDVTVGSLPLEVVVVAVNAAFPSARFFSSIVHS